MNNGSKNYRDKSNILSKMSNLDLLAILYSKGITVSSEGFGILVSKDITKKVEWVNNNDKLVEELLLVEDFAAILLIKRFIKIGWNRLGIVLSRLTYDNPYFVLHLLENKDIKDICRLNSFETIGRINKKCKKRIKEIIEITDKYNKKLL